jgi:ferric-dicitrate binding protein FerR (iron transport regulator)
MEIAGNSNKPFRVNVADKASIEVLGTRFNVNAYANEESISTTLVDGRVRVSNAATTGNDGPKTSALLHPGQQAQIINALMEEQRAYPAQGDHLIKVVDKVDIEKTTAWLHGLFDFQGVRLKEAMRQIERWYDIEVVYEEGVHDTELLGKMTKGVSLNGLMIILDKLGIHHRLEGRRLVILK